MSDSPSPPAVAVPPPSPRSAEAANLSELLAEPAERAWYRRPLFWGTGLLLALLAIGLWWWMASRAAQAAPVYVTQLAARGDLSLTVSANGSLQPTRAINIGSELSGTVLRVLVDVNDRVKKGQILVELDTAKLRGQIQRSQAALQAAAARLDQVAATQEQATATLARLEEVARLSGGKVPAKTELDAARAGLARARADVASARAGVDDARAALATDRINLSKASISSPADGVVLSRSVEPGNAVAASLQAVTLFVIAEDLSRLRLWVYVDEADVGAVQLGQAASFTVSAYPARKFPARITRVGFGSTITDNVVTYLSYLDVDNRELSLRPGMTASATITATQRHDVLLVPNAALRFTPSAAGDAAASGKSVTSRLLPSMPRSGTRRQAAAGASTATARQVWVLPGAAEPGQQGTKEEGRGVPQAVAVLPGISDGRMTEIIGGELKAGMRVITDQKKSSQAGS